MNRLESLTMIIVQSSNFSLLPSSERSKAGNYQNFELTVNHFASWVVGKLKFEL